MDATSLIKSVLPYLGTALGGPLGGGLAAFAASKLGIPGSTVTAVTDSLTQMLGNPDEVLKLKELEIASREHLAQMGYDSLEKITVANLQAQIEINKTMQAEAASDHWPTYGWRPFIGFSFGFYINAQWVLPIFKIAPVELSPTIIMAIGGILGVASYFRGKMQADPAIPTDNRG
jgi:hypothetical protein